MFGTFSVRIDNSLGRKSLLNDSMLLKAFVESMFSHKITNLSLKSTTFNHKIYKIDFKEAVNFLVIFLNDYFKHHEKLI